MPDDELKELQKKVRQRDAQLRSQIQTAAKLERIVGLRRQLLEADLPDWIEPRLLEAMLESEGKQAANHEKELLEDMSPQQVLQHAQQPSSTRNVPPPSGSI